MAAENGEEKLIAVARHIAKTLGRTDTMTDDILQIFSNFDGRFSREKLANDQDNDDDDDRLRFSSMERNLRSLDRQISRYVSSERLIWSDSADAAAFLDAVDALLAVIRDLDAPGHPEKRLLDRADDLLQQSMLRLEDEFRSLIDASDARSSPFDSDPEDEDYDNDDGRIPVAAAVTDYEIIIDALPPGSVADLSDISKRMIAAGFGRELAHAYSLSRREFIAESVSRLGIRPRSADEFQSASWLDLEDEIARWTKAFRLAFRVLFPSERRLCDRVFNGQTSIADLSFAEVCRSPALSLLSFADAVVAGPRAPERLFRVVDMYEAVGELIPDLDFLFADQYSSFLRAEVVTVWKGLGSAIRGIFMELENLIRRDPAKAPVPGGGLHPITRYVMNYLRAACASRKTLEEVMEEDGSAPADIDRPSSSLSVQIAWILEVLQGNLEAKSKIYGNPSLSCVFLMNNGRYIVQKARDSELAGLMGEEWVRRQAAKVRRWSGEYQRATWSKVVAVMRTDEGMVGAAAGKAARERFRVLNAYLEEIWRGQGGWVVVDERLREELRGSTVGLVVPAYRNFVGRYRGAAEGVGKYVKYTPEEVEARIGGMFEGAISGRR